MEAHAMPISNDASISEKPESAAASFCSVIEAAAAAAAPSEMSAEGTTCRAWGACWTQRRAYQNINDAGCCTTKHPPVHIIAQPGLDPSELTVLAARAALSQNAKSAVAVQTSRKRCADDSRNSLWAWVVL